MLNSGEPSQEEKITPIKIRAHSWLIQVTKERRQTRKEQLRSAFIQFAH